MATDTAAIGAAAAGAMSTGFAGLFASTFASGAVAVLSIRRLGVRNAHIQRHEVDEQVVHSLDVRAGAGAH